jgi:hypothetical protein
MKNFCYWHEQIPQFANLNFLPSAQKICLMRQAEYRLDNKTNIFCPYTKEEAEQECSIYKVSEKINE